ncbi:hypothetical protein [Priestia endophytica]|uniref:hypothetical protein n=1 Tax=Priestia endophytica TaxID=135735 RepID=UPI000DCA5737|nr:hypothetical protein [Priestia endophytica]RAS86867.1 hypothetical protein A4R27_00615 [Priestia endophytica]
MEEQQNEKMSPKARWIIGGIVTICLAVLIVVAIQLNKKQEPEVATEATQDKKEKTADEQIGSDLEKALSELKKDKSSEEKKTDSKDKTMATKSSDPFAYLFNPSKSDDPLTFLSIDPTELPDVPEPVVSKTEDVAGVQDDKTPKGPVVTLPTDKITDLPTVPSLPTSDDPTLPSDAVDEGDGDDKVPTDVPGTVIPPTGNQDNIDNQDKGDTGTPDDSNNGGTNKPTPDPDDEGTNKPTPDPDDEGTNKPTPNPGEQLENLTLALPEDTYERLVSYREQQQIYNALYYGNKEGLKDQEVVTLLDEMLRNYNNASDTDITARQLIQSLTQSQLNDEQARIYNAQLTKLKEEIEKVTREEYVDVYVIKEGSSKDQLYYAGTFEDLLNGNKVELEKAKNSEMALADQKASEAAENLRNNKLDELQRKANQKALIEAINSYQLIANYSTEADNEAEAKRNEALRILSESVKASDEPEIENNDTTKVENDEDKTEAKVDNQQELKNSLNQLMEEKKYIQVLQQASAYVEQYPELDDTIKEASEKLLEQSIKDMKSNNAYTDEDTKKYLSQSYAALTGLSKVPNEVSEKAKEEFYGYRLVMQAEKLIESDSTQAAIFAYEGYKRQETDGAKAILQKANTTLGEKALNMESKDDAERAYEILTVTAKGVNDTLMQTAVDRKTAYGYVEAGEKRYDAGEIEEAIAYGSEANRLYPEKNLGGVLVEKTANRLLEEAEQKELTEQVESYNLIVNVKGLDESIKTQAENRKTVIDALDRVKNIEKKEQQLYYLYTALEKIEETKDSAWSKEMKVEVQTQYDACIKDMLTQAQTWSTGNEEEKVKAATYYKAIVEIGKYAGEETVTNAKTELTELGYE